MAAWAAVYPWARCADGYVHGGHVWRDGGGRYWCRGRVPVSVDEARAGAVRLTGRSDADRFVDVCRSTVPGREYLESAGWQALSQAIAASDPPPYRPSRVVRLLAPWFGLVDLVGLRYVPGDPRLGVWWRYVLTEPADAAYSLPRMAACRWFGRHSRVCDGKRDPVHLAWRRARIEQRRATGTGG